MGVFWGGAEILNILGDLEIPFFWGGGGER